MNLLCTLHKVVNTAYSSQCNLKIYLFLFKSSERLSFFCCLINTTGRQQEYQTAVTLRAAQIHYTVTHVFPFPAVCFHLNTVFTRILVKTGSLTHVVCVFNCSRPIKRQT